jgi:hypothetical protein
MAGTVETRHSSTALGLTDPCCGRCAEWRGISALMILSLTDHRTARGRTARLRSLLPYCGPCFDADGEINDLVAFKRYGGPDGMYCAGCGAEFQG